MRKKKSNIKERESNGEIKQISNDGLQTLKSVIPTEIYEALQTSNPDEQTEGLIPGSNTSLARKGSGVPSLSSRRSSSILRFFMSRKRKGTKAANSEAEVLHKTSRSKTETKYSSSTSIDTDEDRLFELLHAYQECGDEDDEQKDDEPTNNDVRHVDNDEDTAGFGMYALDLDEEYENEISSKFNYDEQNEQELGRRGENVQVKTVDRRVHGSLRENKFTKDARDLIAEFSELDGQNVQNSEKKRIPCGGIPLPMFNPVNRPSDLGENGEERLNNEMEVTSGGLEENQKSNPNMDDSKRGTIENSIRNQDENSRSAKNKEIEAWMTSRKPEDTQIQKSDLMIGTGDPGELGETNNTPVLRLTGNGLIGKSNSYGGLETETGKLSVGRSNLSVRFSEQIKVRLSDRSSKTELVKVDVHRPASAENMVKDKMERGKETGKPAKLTTTEKVQKENSNTEQDGTRGTLISRAELDRLSEMINSAEACDLISHVEYSDHDLGDISTNTFKVKQGLGANMTRATGKKDGLISRSQLDRLSEMLHAVEACDVSVHVEYSDREDFPLSNYELSEQTAQPGKLLLSDQAQGSYLPNTRFISLSSRLADDARETSKSNGKPYHVSEKIERRAKVKAESPTTEFYGFEEKLDHAVQIREDDTKDRLIKGSKHDKSSKNLVGEGQAVRKIQRVTVYRTVAVVIVLITVIIVTYFSLRSDLTEQSIQKIVQVNTATVENLRDGVRDVEVEILDENEKERDVLELIEREVEMLHDDIVKYSQLKHKT